MIEFKAALFDLDGTLIDSTHIWRKIDFDFLAKRGLRAPESYHKEISSMNFLQAAEYTNERMQLHEQPKEIMAEWKAMALSTYEHDIKCKPFAREYLISLKQASKKLAICTASTQDLFEPVLKSNGIYDLFDVFVSTEQVKRGKGYPDVYLKAAELLCVNPSDCIVFEDILAGVKGAKAANMTAVGVYDKESQLDIQAIKALADYYIEDFSQLIKF